MSNEQLIAIRDEAKQLRRADKEAPLLDCPVCGDVLDENSRGVVNCPSGHYRQQGRARREGMT